MVWQDQGLYFTLVLNTVAMAVMLPIAHKLHASSKRSIRRLIRPNQHEDGAGSGGEGGGMISSRLLAHGSFLSAAYWLEGLDVIDAAEAAAVNALHRKVGLRRRKRQTGREDKRQAGRPEINTTPGRLLFDDEDEESPTNLSSPASPLISKVSSEPHQRAGLPSDFSAASDAARVVTDPEAVVYLFFLKLCAVMFFVGGLGTVWTAVAAATDDYLVRFNVANDPQNCAGKLFESDCSDNVFCQYTVLNASSTSPKLAGYCSVSTQPGLYDLSVQNVAPSDWRWWIFGIGSLWFAVVAAYALYRGCRRLDSYVMWVMKRQMQRSRGYRTVLVSGLELGLVPAPTPGAESSPADADAGVKAQFLQLYVRNDTYFLPSSATEQQGTFYPGGGTLAVRVGSPERGVNEATTAVASYRSWRSFGCCLSLPTEVVSVPGEVDLSAEVEEVAVERCGDALSELDVAVKEYEARRSELEDAMQEEASWLAAEAAKKASKETESTEASTDERDRVNEEKVLMRRVASNYFLTKVPAVEYAAGEVRKAAELVNKKIDEMSKEQKEVANGAVYTGTLAIRFRTALAAFEFESLFNAAFGSGAFLSNRRACIAGPPAGLVGSSLSANRLVVQVVSVLISIAFFWLVFFWAVPVGFLGSLDSLATLPAPIGPFFSKFTKALPVTVRGTLQAYLPVIVLAVFNIVLPSLVRAFAVKKGAATKAQVEKSSLRMLSTFMVMTGVVMQAALQGGLSQLAAVIQRPSQEAVVAIIIAVVSPQGGYWYAKLLSAAFLSTFLNALLLPQVPMVMLKSKKCTTQRAYDALYARQPIETTYFLACDMVVLAVGLFFHSTVPLLSFCAALYFAMELWIYRWLLLDVHEPEQRPDDEAMSDFSKCSYVMRGLCGLLIVACAGGALVTGLQDHYGSMALCIASAVVSGALLVHVSRVVVRWQPHVLVARELLKQRGGSAADHPRDEGAVADEEGCSAYFPKNKLVPMQPVDPRDAVETVQSKVRGVPPVVMKWEEVEDSQRTDSEKKLSVSL